MVGTRGTKVWQRVAAAAVGAASVAGLTVLPAAGEPAAPVLTTEITVSLRAGAEASEIAELTGGQVARRVPGRPDLAVLRVPQVTASAVRIELERRADVAFAVPNPVASIASATDDPLLSRQWHLLGRTEAEGSSNWVPVGSADLGEGATVALLDTGVTPHADIDGMLPGRDFISDDDDASDPHGHGTHVAGTVGESSDNGLGAAGVAPGAAVLPVRVLDSLGNASYDKIFAGLAYAVESGADIVNLSLAGEVDAGMCDAVERTVEAGVIVIAAAGNDMDAVGYPAACPDAIAVGAVTMHGELAPYSSTGDSIDLTAPGGVSQDLNEDLAPDSILQYATFNGKGGYYYSAGTSMASPHVAGAAAIVRSIRPKATPDQVREVLTSTATDKGAAGTDPRFGAGILDIAAVVSAANSLPNSPAGGPPPERPPAGPASTEPDPEPDPEETEPGTPPEGTEDEPPSVTRLSGDNRYETAAAVSADRFREGSPHVWLATGAGYADALATAAAAGRLTGPLLLVESCGMPAFTGAELSRLRPETITVVGGPAAVCEDVLDDARQITGVQPRRAAGVDRYETATALSRANWVDGAATVVLTSAAGFADALSGGALSASQDAPLLLSATCSLPAASATELDRLQPARVLVMGGPSAVCEDVLDEVRGITGGTVSRIFGPDRFATASAAGGTGWISGSETVFVASGAGFADGLSAGAAAAAADAPLLLVPACGTLPLSVRDELTRLAPTKVVAVGGEAAICPEMLNQVATAL